MKNNEHLGYVDPSLISPMHSGMQAFRAGYESIRRGISFDYEFVSSSAEHLGTNYELGRLEGLNMLLWAKTHDMFLPEWPAFTSPPNALKYFGMRSHQALGDPAPR